MEDEVTKDDPSRNSEEESISQGNYNNNNNDNICAPTKRRQRVSALQKRIGL